MLKEGKAPTPEETAAIWAAANDMIKQNVEIRAFTMERKEAEAKYTANP